MAVGELIAVALLAKAFGGSSSTSEQKPADVPERDQGARGGAGGGAGGVNIGGLASSGVALGGAILAALKGGGLIGASTAAPAAATTGSTTTTGAATGSAISAAAVAAVVIVVVWVVLVVLVVFQMFDAASRRAYRAGLGKSGVKQLMKKLIREKENDFARKIYDGLGINVSQRQEADGANGYVTIITGVTGASLDQMRAVGTAARFLAIEQARGLNESIVTYFAQDFGFTEAQIAANGDAMELADFDALVDETYRAGPFMLTGEAASWGQAQGLVGLEVAAQARFGGRLAAMAYVQQALAGGTMFPAGIGPQDKAAAAAANPVGTNQVAYYNRVFGLGQIQKANVLFDDTARLAWMPLLSPTAAGGPAMFPYQVKPYVTDSNTGA